MVGMNWCDAPVVRCECVAGVLRGCVEYELTCGGCIETVWRVYFEGVMSINWRVAGV